MQFSNINYKKINKNFSTFLIKKFITFGLLFVYILFPSITKAGIFSFLAGATGQEASAKVLDDSNTNNSQNMLVLQAATNSEPSQIKANSEEPLVSNGALIAEIGPAGTASDVDNESTNTQISLYVVHKGDSFEKIAKMFKIDANTIIWANDLDRDTELKDGQKLVILPISGYKYTVKKGDTIKSIATKNKADLREILQYNALSIKSTLNPGDIIVIPDAEPVYIQAGIFASSKTSTDPSVYGTDGPYYPGYYIRPVEGGFKSQGLHGYNAVDIAVPIGTPIHAAAEGTVIASAMGGWHGGYGNYVAISHPNGTQTLYAHTSKNFVKVGDYVQQGQMIAKSGSTGNSTGPHVHAEVRLAKNPF